MSMRRVVHTLDFVRAIKQFKGSFKERMQKVTDLLKKDADRPDGAWLIDLSLALKATSVSCEARGCAAIELPWLSLFVAVLTHRYLRPVAL